MKKWIHKDTFLKVEHKHYFNPSSNTNEHYSIVTFNEHGFCAIVPITSDNKIVFVKQYRPGIDDFILEIPMGRLDHEDPLKQLKKAKEELEEETGYSTDEEKVQRIGEFFLMPARSPHQEVVFIARDVKETMERSPESAEEGSEVVLIDFKKTIKMIRNNEIKCVPSIMAILLVKEKLNL